MNTKMHQFVKAGLVGLALFSLALTASASSTWTPPPAGTPPSCPSGTPGCDAPINVGPTAQTKSGLFEVDGGFISGTVSTLLSHVTIGTAPCPSCTLPGGGSSGSSSGGSAAMAPTSTTFASANEPLTLASAIGGFSDAFTGLFKPAVAEALTSGGSCTAAQADSDASCGTDSNCGWVSGAPECIHTGSTGQFCDFTGMNVCTSGEFCSAPGGGSSGTCQPYPTGGGGGGSGTGSLGSGTDITLPSPPVITLTPLHSTIATGATDSISYSISNASSCTASSSNPTNNWSGAVAVSPSTHSASSSHSLGTFTAPGSFTYTVSCSSPSGGWLTATTNITTGPTYLLDVYGNASIHGYMNVASSVNAGSLQQNGILVCLQNGTDCPTATTSGTVTGTGTVNYVPKFTAAGAIGNSSIFDNGSVGVGTTSPQQQLSVQGGLTRATRTPGTT